MAIDFESTPFLFSAGTLFSYYINCRYYNDVHYVWCTTHFNDSKQPITSNPQSICKRYFEQIATGDRHAKEILENMSGLMRGADAKLSAGVITEEQHNEICHLISYARYEDFYPVLYVIDVNKVGADRCIEVDKKDRASDESVEYRIFDLKEGEYEIIDFKNILSDHVKVVDKKVGD